MLCKQGTAPRSRREVLPCFPTGWGHGEHLVDPWSCLGHGKVVPSLLTCSLSVSGCSVVEPLYLLCAFRSWRNNLMKEFREVSGLCFLSVSAKTVNSLCQVHSNSVWPPPKVSFATSSLGTYFHVLALATDRHGVQQQLGCHLVCSLESSFL